MAAVAVNNFKTVTHSLSTGAPTVIYTAPTGYTSVFLLLQITNTDSQTQKFSLYHRRESTDTALQLDSPIVSKDSLDVLPGKLVLQTGDSIIVQSNANNQEVKFIASVLETLNQ